MPDEISGINMLVAQGGTALIDQTDATLTTTPELAETITKNTNFVNRLPADQNWTLSYEGQIPDSSAKDALTNGNAGIYTGADSDITGVDTGTSTFTLDEDRSGDWSAGDTVRVLGSTGNDQEYTIDTISGTDVTVTESISDSTADGVMFKPVVIPGVQSLTLTLDQELSEVPPGIDQAVGWDNYVALRQDWELDVEGHYYDPNDSAVLEDVHTARENGNDLPAEMNVLGVTFTGFIAADEAEIAAGTDDPASQSLPFMANGELTQTSQFETTIESLIALFFDQSTATVALRHEKNGSIVTGSTIWEGSAFLSSAEITLERDSFPQLTAEFQGDGALSRNTQ